MPPKTSTQTKGKRVLIKEKVIPEIEYNRIEDLKRDKANISLFEVLKIPSIKEGLSKNMVLNRSIESQNHNLEVYIRHGSQKYSTKRIPPFLLTFEIFNRNAHNYMIDLGAYLNVMLVLVCKKLNVV